MTTPNLFILGTTKGGTSTLQLWLGQHPKIGLSEPKELHYFCRCPNPKLRAASNLRSYLDYFSAKPVRGEASPCYLYERRTIEAIAEHFPDARHIVSLRDPVARFWSHYLMNEIYRPTGMPVESVLDMNLERGHSDALNDLFGMGLFGRQLSDVFDVVGRDRVHVLFLEELEADPLSELSAIFDFLGIDQRHIDTSVRDKVYVEPRGAVGRVFLRNRNLREFGVTLLPARIRRFLRTRVLGDPGKKPSAPDHLVERLRQLYAADSRSLQLLLGVPLPWKWHESPEPAESS